MVRIFSSGKYLPKYLFYCQPTFPGITIEIQVFPALRDLIRIALVEEEWENADEEVAGAIVLVYNHRKRELVDKLLDIQHDYNKYIISSQHIHLDHDNCLEIIVVKGSMKFIQEILSKLKSAKGVKHASLTKSTPGKNI